MSQSTTITGLKIQMAKSFTIPILLIGNMPIATGASGSA
jgi:hypothetical protein